MTEAPSPHEAPPPVLPIPQDRIDAFVDGSFVENLDQKGELGGPYFEREERIPGIEEPVTLRMRYERFGNSRSMRFSYATKKEELIASMTVEVSVPQQYSLVHRVVEKKDTRRSGIGTHLLKQVEMWVGQVAARKAEPITMLVEFSQHDVMQWLTKAGYQPTAQSRALYDDIVANVGITDKYIVDEWSQRPLAIHGRTAEGTKQANELRILMYKTFGPTEATETSPA